MDNMKILEKAPFWSRSATLVKGCENGGAALPLSRNVGTRLMRIQMCIALNMERQYCRGICKKS